MPDLTLTALRALEAWPHIEFRNDHDGCLFTSQVTGLSIPRPAPGSGKSSVENPSSSGETSEISLDAPVNAPVTPLQEKLLGWVRQDPQVSYDRLAKMAEKDRSTVMRNLIRLKDRGRLRRIGPDKGGRWEALR